MLSTGSLFTRGRTTDKEMGRKMRRNRNVLKSWEWSMSLFDQLERNTASMLWVFNNMAKSELGQLHHFDFVPPAIYC